ncbi:MAG: spermidine synthase family protein [Planctomycetota bacterium]|jgi:hypothetical protein
MHPTRRFIGIFLFAMAALLLQVTLTRVLSVALWYHFGFLVISTALLGFGASGTLLSVWTHLREKAELDRAMTALAIGFSLSTVLCYWLMQLVPFAPFSMLSDRAQLVWTPLYLILIATPFFFAGLAIALLLTRGGKQVNRFYAWDLAGAGLGCIAVVGVIPLVGASGSIITAAGIGALSALAFALPRYKPGALIAGVLGIAMLAISPAGESLIPVRLTSNKRMSDGTFNVLSSQWNAFSKIDVIGSDGDEDAPASRAFVIDAGTAFTGTSDPKPWLARLDAGETFETVPAFRGIGPVLMGKDAPHALMIGSGAGAETLEALLLGASHVTALEINPIIAKTTAIDPFWGDLFTRDDVTLHIGEGRSFIKRSGDTYDAIISVHTISNAAMAAGALDLSENYVLTRQAFDDYLAHLSDDGAIFFTRPEAHLPRLFSTAREALERIGIEHTARHMLAWRDAPRTPGTKSFGGSFLMRKTPYTDDELRQIEATILAGDPQGSQEMLYTHLDVDDAQSERVPTAKETELDIYSELLTTDDPDSYWAGHETQLSPATDDQPFFNHRTRWSNLSAGMLSDLLSQDRRGRMALEDRPVAELTLIVLLIESIIIASIFILLPLIKFQREGLRSAGTMRWLTYFACLGVGFILIEIVLIQRFTLFLGQPVFTFATVLAGILISSGAGAAFSARLVREDPARAIMLVIPTLVGVLVVSSLIAPPVFDAALGLPLWARVAISLALITPLGFTLGMPFPIGLRAVQQDSPQLVPWTWGINGFFTVIGSVIAMMLGMALGFQAALLVAGVCYVLALLVGTRRALTPST